MSEENVTSNEVAPEVVKEAESQGWVPKERFRGNESDWVDADTFVKRGREILPILRKNNENLIKDLQHTKEQLKEFREAAEEFKKFQKEAYERKAGEYEKRIQEIKESRAQAISDGDGQKVNALDDALDQAKEEHKEALQAVKDADKPSVEAPAPASIDPGLQAWLDTNSWFGQDKRMTAVANGIGESIRLEFPMLKGQAFLDKLDEVLAEELPNKFGNKKQSPTSRVESGSGRQSRGGSNAQSYDNLPADAKAACDKFVKQKLMTREEYVQSYDWS
jgi:seryl-tRNA synthetase